MRSLTLLVALVSLPSSLLAEERAPKWVADLSSNDGQERVGATKAAFDLGERALPALRAAGAKQISPSGPLATGRIDMVYSLIEGLRPNPPHARAGYSANGFGLHVEKKVTREEVVGLGEKHGFKLSSEFRTDSSPSCYVQITSGKSLAEVIRAILLGESRVISVNLNYFEK